jgi:Arc/MetJ family transcription regulator
MNPVNVAILALAIGLAAVLGAIPIHPLATGVTSTTATVTNTTTITTNTTTALFTAANASMAQNATCTAASVHVELSLFFYQKVVQVANLTGELKVVNETLNEALNLTREANESLSKGLCFTALKDAVEAMHIEQGAWSTVIRSYARERHLNVTELARAEAELRVLNRTLAIALRIANETGNQTLVNELKGLINQVKLAGELIKAGNYTGALKVLSSVKESIHNLAKQVHEEARKWAEEYKALHGHGRSQGGGSNSGNGGSGKGHH